MSCRGCIEMVQNRREIRNLQASACLVVSESLASTRILFTNASTQNTSSLWKNCVQVEELYWKGRMVLKWKEEVRRPQEHATTRNFVLEEGEIM
jgi:hypothetical protein